MKNFLEAGEREAGSQKQLALILGVSTSNICDVKRGQRGLPTTACIRLAELIGADPMEVISASELVTEKNEEKISILRRYASHTAAGFTGLIMGVAVSATAMPAPAEANDSSMYIMLNAWLAAILAVCAWVRFKKSRNNS